MEDDPGRADPGCACEQPILFGGAPLGASGQLHFCDWNEAYLPDGRFDQDRMLTMWNSALDSADRAGYPRTRLVAHMEWSLEEKEGVDDLLEYEARFNVSVRGDKDPVICTYDLNRYSGAFIIDVMRTHPMMILGGLLQENPFYTPPEAFLRELKARKRKGEVAMT